MLKHLAKFETCAVSGKNRLGRLRLKQGRVKNSPDWGGLYPAGPVNYSISVSYSENWFDWSYPPRMRLCGNKIVINFNNDGS